MSTLKSVILLSAVVVAVGTTGVATASTTSSAAPKAVGACAKQSGGALRMLEPKNVAKSQHGKCKTGETRVLLPTTVAKGAKGDTGPAGLKGDAGPAGAKGDQGAAGTSGKDGRGFDGAPFNMTFAGDGPWSCSWKADTSTLACVTQAE